MNHTHTHTQSDTAHSSKWYTDHLRHKTQKAWLPNKNKDCVYSADTHHQSQIACGHNHYLLYVNLSSNKAGYPLMRCCCYYRGRDTTSKCHGPTANDWLCPTETRWWNWKMVILVTKVTQIFRQCNRWLWLLSTGGGGEVMVWHRWVNNKSTKTTNNYRLAIWYVFGFLQSDYLCGWIMPGVICEDGHLTLQVCWHLSAHSVVHTHGSYTAVSNHSTKQKEINSSI